MSGGRDGAGGGVAWQAEASVGMRALARRIERACGPEESP